MSTDMSTAKNTDKNTTPTRRAGKLAAALSVIVAVFAGVLGVAAPAQAAVQTYHSTPVNGMWHSGNVQFHTYNTKLAVTVNFNDRAGDAYCTQLRARVYQSNGVSSLFTIGSVCNGRSATLSDGFTAYPGTRLTYAEIWTVRADGGLRSYVWSFQP